MDHAQKIIETLKTTVLGMGIVLGTLYILSLILDFMRYIFYHPKQEIKKNVTSKEVDIATDNIKSDQQENTFNSIENNNQENEMEIVAVITAALSNYLKIHPNQIKIGSIRQIHKTTPTWGMAARYESSNNKL